VTNLKDAVISSSGGILMLGNTNITLNGHTTLDGDATISLAKEVFGINSATQAHELFGFNEYYDENDPPAFEGEQVEIGSENVALCLNHKTVDG
jgi:hypothetical protein